MLRETPKLAVAIPCYKRTEWLERCLESITSAAASDRFPIYVVDDSCDGTNDAMLARFSLRHPGLQVIRNEVNLGIDRNICKCVEVAQAEYVWLLGEDDLMYPGAVPRLLESGLLDRQHPFVFVNYSYMSADQQYIFRERSIDVTDNCELPFAAFVSQYLWAAGFIGGCVIRRDNFVASGYRRFIGTYYAHVGGISLATLGNTVGIHGDPLIYNRVGDAATFTWSADSYGVFQGWRRLLRMLAEPFGGPLTKSAWASHKGAHGYLGLRFLIAKKADGLLHWPHLRTLCCGDVSAQEKTLAVAAYACPQFVAKMIRDGYASLRRTRLKKRSHG